MTTISKGHADIHISPKKIEELAPTLSVKQFLKILSKEENRKYLLPLVVGFPPIHFYLALKLVNSKQMGHLKLLTRSEPLQHQMLHLIHLLEKEEEHEQSEISTIEEDIRNLEPLKQQFP